LLRAERSGHGNGRVYTISVEALDDAGTAPSGMSASSFRTIKATAAFRQMTEMTTTMTRATTTTPGGKNKGKEKQKEKAKAKARAMKRQRRQGPGLIARSICPDPHELRARAQGPGRDTDWGKVAEQPRVVQPMILIKPGDQEASFDLTTDLRSQRMAKLERLISVQFGLQLGRAQAGLVGVRQPEFASNCPVDSASL